MCILTSKAQAVLAGLTKHGAMATLIATPGPILAFIEQLLTQLEPMLLACLPTIATPQDVLNALQAVPKLEGVGYRLVIGITTRQMLRDGGEPSLNGLAMPIKDSVVEQCGLCTLDDATAVAPTVLASALTVAA